MPAHFGTTLRLLRTVAGVPASRLAEGIGVSPAYISRVEHGHDPPPTPDRLRAISLQLGLAPDRLLDIVDLVRPDALEWLGATPEGRHLAVELRRRKLGPAQLARIVQLVRSEYPVTDRTVGSIVSRSRVLLNVEAADLRSALEVAALRLDDGPAAIPLAAALLASQAVRPGTVGVGLLLAHAVTPHADVRGCLLSLAHPLDVATPDGEPVRTVLALVGRPEGLTNALIDATRLAERGILSRIEQAQDADQVLSALGELRAD